MDNTTMKKNDRIDYLLHYLEELNYEENADNQNRIEKVKDEIEKELNINFNGGVVKGKFVAYGKYKGVSGEEYECQAEIKRNCLVNLD